MSIFRHKLSRFSSSLNCILICQLIILKLSFATSVDSIVKNGQPASSSSSETLEFSDSIPGFEQHEFQSLRIKPLNTDKHTSSSNRSTITKVTTSATLAATLLKKVGLPSSSAPKYSNNNNKTILNSVLIKRINRPTATLISSTNLITTTPIPNDAFDDTEIFKRHSNKLSSNGKLLRLPKKKKAKQTTYKSLNSSSLHLIPSSTTPATTDIDNNDLTSSSLAPSGLQATEQHVHYNSIINHGGGAISTIRRTLNSGSAPSIEHLQIGFPPPNNAYSNDAFPNFPALNLDFTPPPIPQPNKPPLNSINHQQPPSQSVAPPKLIQQPPHDEQPPVITQPTIYSSNRNNGRLRGAHKKQIHVNRRKSAALLKDNELNNQIVPVSVGIPNSFQNVKPADLPNFAELSFFGYRSDQDTPRSFNEREHYSTNNNNNNNNNNFNHENHHYNNLPPAIVSQPPIPNSNNNNNQPQNSSPRLNGPSNEFNFNLHPFFSNERRNQPNNNDLYQFFDSPFMPINPPNIHNINTFSNIHHGDNHQNHQLNHHHQINHQIYHQPIDNEINNGPLHPINTPPNGQFFQRRKLTLSNGNTAPPLNEISNNLGYGYPSYSVYKGDEEAGIKYPKIFKFVDGRVNLNDFEKEKKLGKIEFGKSVAEDGNEYTFSHVRRDLFLILHGGSFSY